MVETMLDKLKSCRACGKEFMPKRYWQEFCSTNHQKTWYYSAQQLGAELVQAKQHMEMFKKILKDNLTEADRKTREKEKKQKKGQTATTKETRGTSERKTEGGYATGRDNHDDRSHITETWRSWIDRNYSSESEKKLFIEDNMLSKETFIDLDQKIGETNAEFRIRRHG